VTQIADNIEKELWDVLVIGAGPAGALAARELARRGMTTLLVDSNSFPRIKVCGGYVNGRALTVLQSVGLGTLCDDLGGSALSKVEIRSGTQKVHIPLPTGVAISRRTLDAALVQEAIREGVEFLPGTKATVTPERDPHSRHAILRSQDATPFPVRAKVVLACDGLSHSSLRQLGLFQSRVAPRARIGVGGVAEDASSCYPEGQIFMSIGRRGYAGLTRVESGQICLAAALDVDYVRELGMRDAVLQIMQDAGTPVSKTLGEMPYHGTPPLTRHTPVLADERLFLLGDAAGYVEPFTGEGMAMAWTGAKQIVPIAAQAAESWDPSLVKQWKREYQRAIGKRLTICRSLTSMIRHPWAVKTTLGILSAYPKLCNPIVGRINNAPFDLKACTP
jgi:flavin-dependent dehydrogenase